MIDEYGKIIKGYADGVNGDYNKGKAVENCCSIY
jgi:hypothetical protein